MNRKLLFFIIAVMVIAVFASGCAQVTGSIEITTIPVSAALQDTAAPSEAQASDLPLLSDMAEYKFSEDIDNDGSNETITITSPKDEYSDVYVMLNVSGKSGANHTAIDIGTYESSFITRTPSGKACIIINIALAYYSTYMFSFEGIKPVSRDCPEYVTDVTGTTITAEGYLDAVGTWHYFRKYELTDDFTFEPVSDYEIVNDKESLQVIKKLPVEMLSDGVYVPKKLDVGENIYPIFTDGDTLLGFKLEDGSEGRILFEKVEGQYNDYGTVVRLIGDKSEFEYFENIDYTDEQV